MKNKLFFFSLFIVFNLWKADGLWAQNESKKSWKGTASYYANKFEGRKTSSGEKYRKDSLTAAHKTLPFGTKIRVTNLNNNKTVVVRVNDRLPKKSKRVIDLSRAAAIELDFIRSGLVKVELEVVE